MGGASPSSWPPGGYRTGQYPGAGYPAGPRPDVRPLGGRPLGGPSTGRPGPTAPNRTGAAVPAVIGGGVICLLATLFIFFFWPVAIVLFMLAAVYASLLGTGMPPLAGASTTIAHGKYLWSKMRSSPRPTGAPQASPPTGQQFPSPPAGRQFPSQPTGQQFPSPPTGQRFANPPTGQRFSNPPTGQQFPSPQSHFDPPATPPPIDQPTEIVSMPALADHGFTAAQAADPTTEQAVLAQIAASVSDLHIHLATNPSTYPDLLDWLGAHGAPEAREAVARRRQCQAESALNPEHT